MTISPLALMLGLVIGQRLSELVIARRNTRRLLARGGREIGRQHYPLFIVLHAAWIAAMAIFIPYDRWPYMPLIVVYLLLQLARVWVITSLGPYWTTRIITLDGAPIVKRGPYRFIKHPNYLVVGMEILTLPLAFQAWWIAIVFTVLNTALIGYRISVEERALSARAS
ncbi:MAG TPA: isoprenylcysteine carboxylmethyltransferase family protein [Caulobacteraceae bacterium]|nr:isoprenylcysteine carboxylmethyltransferase family protein [Caulobacteraceae bacterium]